MSKICVFAGTSEGRGLIENLCGRGAEIVACTATGYGGELLGVYEGVRVQAGRMDAEQMVAFFAGEEFDLVVDATHPYADIATENIKNACVRTNTEYLRLARESGAGDSDGVFVPDVAACVEYLKNTDGNVFLTTGSKDLPAFCADKALRARLYARVLPLANSLKICADCAIAADHIIAMQGPFDEELNLAMLRSAKASYMVTKDTGSAGGYAAKIAAAQRAGAQAVIIGRPRQEEGLSLADMERELEKRLQLAPVGKRVRLVGIGMGNADTRTMAADRAIREADCLIGAKRMLESIDAAGREMHAAIIAGDIARIVRESSFRRFAVLLSGDTGFYSGAKKLIAELDGMDVDVLPGIGSLQYFCAKLGRTWEDVRAISLHGREANFEYEVRTNVAVFALLGGADGANRALERLCRADLGALQVHIGERLGYADERITQGAAEELACGKFDPLSVLLVENPGSSGYTVTHGLPDEAFDRDETPMTKSEIRSISISKLQLTRDAIVYDVGSGSGSVSVEAALQAAKGKVYAIEMKESAATLTKRNAEKFHLANLELIVGKAPEALAGLPAPTHAFIGGSSGSMRGIIDCLLEKNPEVRIVVNAVTLETIAEMCEIAKGFAFSDIAEVSVSKPRRLGRYRLMTAQNPVYIFTLQNGGYDEGGEEAL